VNGAQIAWVGNNRYSFILREGLYPPCGERWEYHVTAFRGLLESPPSNTAYWTGEPCPRQYRVIFDRLITGSSWGDPGDLEDYYGRGPIYGRFSVYSGFPIYSLGFSAADHESIFGHLSCDGYRLILNNEVDILDVIFRNSYSAPDRNYFTIEVDPEDDLSIGGHIMDCDRFGGDDRLFDGAIVLRASDITPGEYEINNRNITLVVRIEEIVGP